MNFAGSICRVRVFVWKAICHMPDALDVYYIVFCIFVGLLLCGASRCFGCISVLLKFGVLSKQRSGAVQHTRVEVIGWSRVQHTFRFVGVRWVYLSLFFVVWCLGVCACLLVYLCRCASNINYISSMVF